MNGITYPRRIGPTGTQDFKKPNGTNGARGMPKAVNSRVTEKVKDKMEITKMVEIKTFSMLVNYFPPTLFSSVESK